jgi:putative intracellular protease/amidase
MNKHNSILIVVTSHEKMTDEHKTGIWFEEYAIPASIFKQAGKKITVASIKGGEAPIDPRSMPTNTDDELTRQALDELKHTAVLSEVKLADFDAVFFPGGHGTMYDLPTSTDVSKTIAEFIETGRVVGAVCHGPAAFVGAMFSDGTPVVKGRKLTSFTNDEERAAELDNIVPFLLQSKLDELGAEFVTSPNWNDNVVVDGKLITGQNPQSSASTAKALMDAVENT